jgi:hypothetical protein
MTPLLNIFIERSEHKIISEEKYHYETENNVTVLNIKSISFQEP